MPAHRVTLRSYSCRVTEPLPLTRSAPLQGRDLRHACPVVLARSRPLTITELLAELSAAGFTVAGDDPRKVLSDRLRYEVGRRRIRKGGRGCFGLADAAALGPGVRTSNG